MVSESFYYAKRGISEENKIWGEVLSGYVSDFPQKKNGRHGEVLCLILMLKILKYIIFILVRETRTTLYRSSQ